MIVKKIKTNKQQSLIPLGEVRYMDHLTPFGTTKNQSSRICPLMISSNIIFGLPLLLFTRLVIMQYTLLVNASCGLLCTCPNYLNWFPVIFFLYGCYTNHFLYICIPYSSLYDHTSISTFSFLLLSLFSHVFFL